MGRDLRVNDAHPPLPISGVIVFQAFRALWGGAHLLIQRPRLIKYIVLPIGLGMLISSPVIIYADIVWSWFRNFFPSFEHSSFLNVFFRGTAHFAAALLVLITWGLSFVGSVKIIAAPFNDLLSEQVEQIRLGAQQQIVPRPQWFPAFIRALRITLIQFVLFLATMLLLFWGSLFLPGIGATIVSGVMVVVSSFWLTYDAMSYSMDRRLWTFRQRLRWLLSRPKTVISFGLGCYGVLMIPVINLFFFPLFVAGGTLLFLELDFMDQKIKRSSTG